MNKKTVIIVIIAITLAFCCGSFCVISLLSGYKYWHDYPEIDWPLITEKECKEKMDNCFENLLEGEDVECYRDSCERFKHGGWLYIFYSQKSECDDILNECLIRKEAWENIICPKNCDYYTKYLPKIEEKNNKWFEENL